MRLQFHGKELKMDLTGENICDVGSRVFTIIEKDPDEKIIYSFGSGIFIGYGIPKELFHLAEDLQEMNDIQNEFPIIKLDSGEIVYGGCECFWGEEEMMIDTIKKFNYSILYVTSKDLRQILSEDITCQ